METQERHKLPVQGILMQLAACPNPHLIETVVQLVLADGRYEQWEYEAVARYAATRIKFMQGRL